MFVGETTEKAPVSSSFGLRIAAIASGIMTLIIGIYPEPFLQLAQRSILK
jgi:NADH:ubiquinone oxidoreductase subunit 2 (subunit N)